MNRWVSENGMGVGLVAGLVIAAASLPTSTIWYLVAGVLLIVLAIAGPQLRRFEAGPKGFVAEWADTFRQTAEQGSSENATASHEAAPSVTGGDAAVLRRIADAIESNPPATPADLAKTVSRAVAEAVSRPILDRGESQPGGMISILERASGELSQGSQISIQIVTPGVTFDRLHASVNSSDLKLGSTRAATSSEPEVAADRREGRWIVYSASAAGPGAISVSTWFDVSEDAPTGPLRVTVTAGKFVRPLVVGYIGDPQLAFAA